MTCCRVVGKIEIRIRNNSEGTCGQLGLALNKWPGQSLHIAWSNYVITIDINNELARGFFGSSISRIRKTAINLVDNPNALFTGSVAVA